VGLFVLGGPIIALLFEHGRFTPQDTARTLYVLRFLIVGLVGYGMSHLLTRAFYALKDTKTPVLISALAVGANIALDYLLIGPLGIGGLALATSLAGLIQMAALALMLRRRLGTALFAPLVPEMGEMLLSAFVMGASVYGLDLGLAHLGMGEFGRVGLGVTMGIVTYGGFVLWRRLLPELHKGVFTQRKREDSAPGPTFTPPAG